MKYLDEYRAPDKVLHLAESIARTCSRPWKIMEVCGGQTHSFLKHGLDRLLSPNVELLHGPGCPVCITPIEYIDKAIAIAETPGTILCSFGDMLRVPGSSRDLLGAKASGADIRIVYSPLDALRIAITNPQRRVVFFGVGFETTAPATAMAVAQAAGQNQKNFLVLAGHVRVPPAMDMLLESATGNIDGFLAAGHVCAIMGLPEYESLASRHRVPIVVTGFEPVDLMKGIHDCVLQLEAGRHAVENAYRRVVRPEGNLLAQKLIRDVFGIVDRSWRGLGTIADSGFELAPKYAGFNAEEQFNVTVATGREPDACQSGRVLQGLIKPDLCPAFGVVCTPEHPLGATMVSSEGACAAYHRYRQTGGQPTATSAIHDKRRLM